MADRASGAAWLRRQRRLRSWWRHGQQTVAAVLATMTHHSHSKVGTANALRGQKMGTSTGVGPAEFSSDDGRPTTVMRPASMSEPWPQGRCSGTQASGTKSSTISTLLCCRWWNSCQRSSISSPRVCRWLSSRFSTCPRSHSTGLSSAWGTVCVNHRRRTSWWKCPRSYPMLLYSSRLPSRSSTLLHLVVAVIVAAGEVFKGYAQDRVQQHVQWSRSLTSRFLKVVVVGLVMEVLKVFPRDRVQQCLVEQIMLTFWFRVLAVFMVSSRDRLLLLHQRTRLVLRMRLLHVFSHFSPFLKVRGWVRTRVGTGRGLEPIHAASLWRAHGGRGGRV